MRESTNGSCNASIKKINRCRSFHFRYLELCRAKNYSPTPEIKSKNNATSVLDFFGDKLKVDDWLFVIESLHYDQILQHIAIRLRKNFGSVVEHIDNEKKAKVFKQKPAVYTKYIITGIVDAVANCIQFNKNLIVLNLEALPLNEKNVVSIAKALSSTEQLRQISFQRSPIGDKGCEAICSTIKYLASVDTINLSECNLTVLSATYIGDMIKFQKICRYSDGWQKSLRYREVDPNTMPGLRVISIARNPNITDEGVSIIVEILKEDAWIKIIDMENCGVTDIGANLILDCLEINNSIIDFNIRNNNEVSKFLQRNIRQQLGKDEENSVEGEDSAKKSKISVTQLKERLKFLEEQIASEKVLRKQVELLNEKLHKQIVAYENQLIENRNADIPEGYVLVKNESLESIINERNDLYKAASMAKLSKTKGYLKKISKVRKVKSEVKYKQQGTFHKISKSDCEFGGFGDKIVPRPNNIIFEKNIGDNVVNYQQQLTGRVEKNVKLPFIDNDAQSISTVASESEATQDGMDFNVVIRKKQNCDENAMSIAKEQCPSPRSFFLGLRT